MRRSDSKKRVVSSIVSVADRRGSVWVAYSPKCIEKWKFFPGDPNHRNDKRREVWDWHVSKPIERLQFNRYPVRWVILHKSATSECSVTSLVT